MRLKRWVLLWLCITLSLGAKPLFELTPEMYASIMVKSMEGNLPQTFKPTTAHYKGIMEELKKHRSLPEDIQKQCKEFAKLSFVNQGVNYVLHVEAKNEKPLVVVYDKEACNAGFDPHQKIFIGGYNRYGIDQNGYTRKGTKL